ncbi:MAG: FGGY-family carbohydrate kinase [Chloroflexota bacterium]|nr:FGGY-family carbohydrate kinase [Chloroflexota bacterium]
MARANGSELLLAVDIGSSSSKGLLARADGRIVATTVRAHEVSFPRPGWAEHDALSVWWRDFVGIAQELSAAASTMGHIAGVGVSGIGPCLLPVDDSGAPLRPAILYGIDTRATREIDELTDRFGAEAILARGGSLLTSQAVGPKFAWLRRNEPDVWARTKRFHMANSFVIERLTGEYVLDHHSASQCDPLYDMGAATWAAEWAGEVAPGIEFPRLAWSDEVVGTVSPEGSAASGIPVGTPVVAGTVDAWAEAVSVGVRQPGDTMLMYGTTMFMVQVAADPRPRPALWNTMGVSPDARTFAAGLSPSGGLTTWFRELVGSPPFEELLEEAAATPPGAGGLVALPYFGVARSPIFDPQARGMIVGLSLTHGRGHLFRALLEGTAFEVRHNLEVMEEAGAEARRLVAVGGGTKSRLWAQVVSDVTGYTQVIPAETIGASYGDALLAARGVGLVARDTDWSQPAAVLEADPTSRPRYDALYGVYRRLYHSTLSEVHELSQVQESDAREPAQPTFEGAVAS